MTKAKKKTSKKKAKPMTLNVETLTLLHGAHSSRKDGVCLLEAVAWAAGEKHSDKPACVCPVLAEFGRTWNDQLTDDLRQRLKPFVSRLVGTKGSEALERRRSLLALDWLIRTYVPAWLRLAGHAEEAEALERAGEIVDDETALAVATAVRAADAKATAARNAAWNAAENAARNAAWNAAEEAVRPTRDRLIDSAQELFDRMTGCQDSP